MIHEVAFAVLALLPIRFMAQEAQSGGVRGIGWRCQRYWVTVPERQCRDRMVAVESSYDSSQKFVWLLSSCRIPRQKLPLSPSKTTISHQLASKNNQPYNPYLFIYCATSGCTRLSKSPFSAASLLISVLLMSICCASRMTGCHPLSAMLCGVATVCPGRG